MKELDLDTSGRRFINRLDGARELMEQWDNPRSMANRVPYSFRKSDYGNINNTGGTGELPASILPPLHPQFEQFVEAGVRDLVVVVARHHRLITYTSCEGHRYGEGGPPSSERHVGVLSRSKAEYDAVERAFVSVGHQVNALALTPHIHLGVLRQLLRDREAELPTLDLYLAKNTTSSWDDYFASLGPTYAATVERLKAFDPLGTPSV
ncbi:MAG TPA: hypothetical protein VEY88_15050 [Archangium sp.]|nr:hypothetical protein [Archangium sp.]